jgi:hypothetical protein
MNIFGYPFHPVKIGTSKDPNERAKVYLSGPFPTAWLGSWEVEGDGCAAERLIHCQFKDYRLAGEWFYPVKKLMTMIERKVGIPIAATMCYPPTRKDAEFEMRFVRLFPEGIASIEAEWDRPGKAKPCSDARFQAGQARLDALEWANNPLIDTPIWTQSGRGLGLA